MASQQLILDTNVIVSLLPYPVDEGALQRRDEVSRMLRRCFLLYCDIVVPDVVLHELGHFSSRMGRADETRELVESLGLTKVVIPRKTGVQLPKGYKRAAPAVVHGGDACLISYVTSQNADIYSLDRQLLASIGQHAHVKEGTFSLWFPIDDDKLKGMSFGEIKRHGELFRSAYSSDMEKLKQLDTQLLSTHRQQAEVLAEKDQTLAELQDSIAHKDAFISDLKDLAKPHLGFTLTFSAVELAVACLPVPIPTSPISHIIQARQYKRVISKHER